MSQPLRVEDFVDELRKYERKEDFMTVMHQYEQRFYDQFEQYANNNFPPELQRQQQAKQETSWKQQPVSKPPMGRSNSANKLEYQEPFQIFNQQYAPQQYQQQQQPQQIQQTPQRLPSRGETQDPFKRPEPYDYRTINPNINQDPFSRNQQQQIFKQASPLQQPQNIQMPQQTVFPVFQQQQQNQFPQQQYITQQQYPSQQQYSSQQQYAQYNQQNYDYNQNQKNNTNIQQQQQMEAFLNDIKNQRMQKQQQYK